MQSSGLSDYNPGSSLQHQLSERHKHQTEKNAGHQKSYAQSTLIVDETKQYMDGLLQHQLNERHKHQTDKNVGLQKSYAQPLIVDETKQYMDGLLPHADHVDEDSEDETMKDEVMKDDKILIVPAATEKKPGKKTRGRVKIKMEFIQNKLRRYTTFSKRKTGIMKKAYELSTLTGTQVMLLVASETGHVYTFATRKLQPMITSESGKALIQTCLNSPDPSPAAPVPQPTVQPAHIAAISAPIVQAAPTQVNLPAASEQRMSQTGYEEPDLQYSNSEDELKVVQSTPGSIHYVTSQSASSFPMTNYIAPTQQQNAKTAASYAVQPGITTIFSPAGSSTNGASVHLQAAQSGTQQQPQILSGQLQIHRIHPQNIILTGNSSGLQSNHIILNPSGAGSSPIVMAENSDRHSPSTSQQQQQEDVITLVNSELSNTPLQMVYSPSNGVIYAPQSSTFKRSTQDSSGDVVSLQHTPVIQTALQQDSSGVVNRHIVEGAIIVRQNQGDMNK